MIKASVRLVTDTCLQDMHYLPTDGGVFCKMCKPEKGKGNEEKENAEGAEAVRVHSGGSDSTSIKDDEVNQRRYSECPESVVD